MAKFETTRAGGVYYGRASPNDKWRRVEKLKCRICSKKFWGRADRCEPLAKYCSHQCANKRARDPDPELREALKKIADLYGYAPEYMLVHQLWELSRKMAMLAADALGIPWHEIVNRYREETDDNHS